MDTMIPQLQEKDLSENVEKKKQIERAMRIRMIIAMMLFTLMVLVGNYGVDSRLYYSSIAAPPVVRYASTSGFTYIEKFTQSQGEISAILRSEPCLLAGIALNVKFVLFPQSYRHDISFREVATRFGLKKVSRLFGLIADRPVIFIKKSEDSNLISVSSPGEDVRVYRVGVGTFSEVKDNSPKDNGDIKKKVRHEK